MDNRQSEATLKNLLRLFTIPEHESSTLSRVEKAISENLNQFLQQHIAAEKQSLSALERSFNQVVIPEQSSFVSDHSDFLLKKVVAHSVHTSSPSFIGHMTSALPYFLLPLSKIMIGLNQNLVKIETSKVFTPLERQVLGMLHHLIYQQEDSFYETYLHSRNHSLGAFCSGGTIANITALWVARNNLLKAEGSFRGINEEGLVEALRYYGYAGLAILVSKRAHYSLYKAADLLGIGKKNLIIIDTDDNNKVDVKLLKEKIDHLRSLKIKPIAIIGIAGTTETGNIDPLEDLAQIAQEYQCHFHVDAAWGGAALLSNTQRHLLKGIELADSVTIDAHKQLYLPMGAGMVIFKNPTASATIAQQAQYIIRKGSKDLGRFTLEGSRSGMAMLLFSALQIISRPGYEMLINMGIEKAHFFAQLIEENDDFELITKPELCLLTYRYLPKTVYNALNFTKNNVAFQEVHLELQERINKLTIFIQKEQREAGKSFVSRTLLNPICWKGESTNVFRVVLANPLTTNQILIDILEEQTKIAQKKSSGLAQILELAQTINMRAID